MKLDEYGAMLPRAKKGPFRYASNHLVKQIIHNQLDCSYKTPFEIGVYHDAQCYAIRWGLKWVRLKKRDWDTRNGFVSSSSASFVIPKNCLTEEQIDKIQNYSDFCHYRGWDIEVTDIEVSGWTDMDNFSMENYLSSIGVDMTKVVFDGDNYRKW